MTELLRLVTDADRRSLPTLSQLSADDIENIWADVSAYIENQMALQKGVCVAGLGTFTLSQQKLDLGNKFTMIQRPIFILSGKLVHSLNLKQPRPLAAATHLPVVPLNYTAVSRETPFSRDITKGCIRETLLVLVRTLASEQNVLFPFHGIGVLSFKNNKVQMKFRKDFITAMDGTGSLLLAFKKRPGSSASLMSGGLSGLQRPQTVNYDTLPTVHSLASENHKGQCLTLDTDHQKTRDIFQQPEVKSHRILQPAKTKAVIPSEEVNPKPRVEASDNPRPLTSPPETLPTVKDPRMSCSGHNRAGQELCYLCMQRANRNVPVFLRKQRQAEEKAHEKLLLFKEQQKEKLFMEEEQAKVAEQREFAKEIAAFNLHMSAKKDKTHSPLCLAPDSTSEAKTSQIHVRAARSDRSKARTRGSRKAEPSESERLEQVQLLQGLALLRSQQLEQKREKTQQYKEALDAQSTKGVPVCRPDDFHFQRCENADDKSREQAQKLFQANFIAATQRKQDKLHERQTQLEKEREMLKQNQIELILDHMNHFEKRQDMGKSLTNDWRQSVKLKQQREDEERHFLRSAGQLLVDRLVEYRRCCQCKRRTSNCGQSNIWRDSQCLSGSQFMI